MGGMNIPPFPPLHGGGGARNDLVVEAEETTDIERGGNGLIYSRPCSVAQGVAADYIGKIQTLRRR
jgi:hypothetical protein